MQAAATSRQPLPARLAPRGMTRAEAAAYCGLSPTSFDGWIAAGRMPKPIPGTKRWDARAIDAAWDRLSGLTTEGQPADDDFAAWLRENGHAS